MAFTRRVTFAALAAFLFIASTSAEARQIVLVWDQNSEPEVTGYVVSYGTQSGIYTNSVDVGNLTSYQFDLPGTQYFFVVRAYTAAGIFSPYSAEVAESSAIALMYPGDQIDAPGDTVSLQLVATGTPTSYAATGLPGGLSINASTGRISGTISSGAGTSSPYLVSASVSNASGNISSVQFTWTVAANNRAPALTNPGNRTSAENATLSLQLVASDLDGDAVTYSVTGLPAALTINAATGLIAGTLSYTSAGSYSVTATASDWSLSTSQTFTWTVTNVDRAPALTAPANQTSAENTSVSLQLVASDPDGDALTYSATGLPSALTVNAATGLISGTVASATAGVYPVTATVSDGSLATSRTCTWTITSPSGTTSVDLSPQDTFAGTNSVVHGTGPTLHTYTWPANQIANAILMKFDLSQVPAGATIQSATLFMYLVEPDPDTASATYTITLHKIVNHNPDLASATGYTYDGVNAWTASTCCYNNIPLAQSDITAVRSTTAVNRTLGFKTWDATTTVQEWLTTAASNFGLLLNSDPSKGADHYRYFASTENAATAQRPYLHVTYAMPSDTTPPAVAVTAPAGGATVAGTSTTLAATASDNVGVVGVQFTLDGVALGAEDTTAPYAISWNTTTTSNAAHTLTAVARDAAGNAATSASVAVTVNNVPANRAPTLTAPANQTRAENAVVSLPLVASDLDGDALTYSATGLPASLTVNAATGLISGTLSYTSAGTYSSTATVSDGSLSASQTFTWIVTNVNRAPTLTMPASQTTAENTSVSLQLVGSDPDGTAVTYTVAGLPASLTVNATTGLIAGILSYTSGGTYTVTATVSDGSLSASQSFTWTVTNVNRAPALTMPANQTTAENTSVSLQLVGSDPDGDVLTYSATGLPSALTANTATGLISGTLSYASAGTYAVAATVSDGNLSTNRTFTWTVTNVNRAPALTMPANQTNAENASVSLQLVASDPDGDLLTYSATGLPSALTVNAATGLISGTVASATAGVYPVTVTVSDGNLSTSRTFTWTVTNVNRAPTLTLPASQTTAENTSVSLQLVSSDPDGDAVTYSVAGLPASLTVNATAGLIAGTLSYTSAGSYSVTATVSDGSLSASQSFTWTVTNVNRAPALTLPASQTTAESTSVSLQLVSSDPDGDAVTYSATSLPSVLTVNAATGLISGTLSYTSAGTYSSTATVSDGSLSASQTFTWTVTNVNRPPTMAMPANQTNAENTSVSLQLVASDPDGGALTYSATGLPSALTVNAATGLISGTVASATAGVYPVTVTVSDGSLSTSRTCTWTITSPSGTMSVDLSPQDTFAGTNSVVHGTGPTLHTYTWPANQIGNAILMKFDLSQVPAAATIQSATLFMYLVEADPDTASATYTITLHKIVNHNPDLASATGYTYDGVNAWTASTCCYNNIPLAQSDITAVRSTTAVDRTLGFKTWDATTTVQEWLTTAASNFGLLLNSDSSKGADRYRYFASTENAATAQRPYLHITYAMPAPDTTPPAVAVTAPAGGATVAGTSTTLAATASDNVGVVGVQFTLDGVALGAEDTTAPYAISWDTTTTSNATHTLTAVARDAAGNTATSASVAVTVNNVPANRAPTLTAPANQTRAENAVVSLPLVASDLDGDALTYGATGLPSALTVNAATGLISGTLSYTSAGTYSVTATVSDGSLSASQTFMWTVTNVNRAPTLTMPASQTTAENTSVSLQLVGNDPDGDAVTYTVAGLPASLTVNATTGLIAGTLLYTSAGTYSVTATASDGSLSKIRTFTWTVTNVDRAPALTAPANQTSVESAVVSLQLVASDPDGDTLTYSATGLPSALTVNAATGLISGTVASATAGAYPVTVTVSDGSLSTSQTCTWTITSPSETTSVDLSPQDTFAGTNSLFHGTRPTLNTYTWPANQIANAILMKFDLSQVPAAATIQSATLFMYLVEPDPDTASATYTITLHKIVNHNPDLASATGYTYDGVNAWTASTCCYNNIPLAQSDITAVRSTTAVDRTLGFKTWDATTTVQEWLTTAASNFGLLLNSDPSKGADHYRYFASTENSVKTRRPYLRIVYSIP